MSCGGELTIYGLFAEDDIESEEACQWNIYARPECLPEEECFEFDCTILSIPFGSLFDNTTAVTWYFELEFNSFSLSPTRSPIWMEKPYGGPVSAWFAYAADSWSSAFPLDATTDMWTAGIGHGGVLDDANLDYEPNEWIKVRVEREAITNQYLMTHWNIDRGQGPLAQYPILAPTLDTLVPSLDLNIGANNHVGGVCFNGMLRNVKFVVDGVTLGDWPITGDPIILGGIITDVSGNDNHGFVEDVGTGAPIECP
jgi:hypothetical protein